MNPVYTIVFRDTQRPDQQVTAYEMTSRNEFPGMLVFLDSRCEPVTLISLADVISVNRDDPGGDTAGDREPAAPGDPGPATSVSASPGITVHVHGFTDSGQILHTTMQRQAPRRYGGGRW